MKRLLLFVALALQLQSHACYADVELASLFREGAVLQQGKSVAVWGFADPGEQVTVNFKGQQKHADTAEDGRWMAHLDPLAASSEPAELCVSGKNTLIVKGVLVGDVWLCSGQSNMNLPLSDTEDPSDEIAAADYPLIHYFEVRSCILKQPVDVAEGEWQTCTPDVAGRFTAVGYYFAKAVQSDLGTPIGIIKSTLGGSPIEGWMSADVLKNTLASLPAYDEWQRLDAGYEQRAAEYRAKLAEWESRAKVARQSDDNIAEAKPLLTWIDSDRSLPSGLYNGFIHPLEPFTLAGILWYQGESNIPRPREYSILFPKLINQWRLDFQQPELPFLFVQLPNYAPKDDLTGESWPRLREAQAAALKMPNVGMAVTTDIGDSEDLHPRNKKDVGHRLAQIALRRVYGRGVEDGGPVVTDVEHRGRVVLVHFANANGLKFEGDTTKLFLIAGPNKEFVSADARIDGQNVVVSSREVSRPAAIRMNWENNPKGAIVNAAGLPAAPFRTDDW
jgi:sialate O-acetylesterase